METGVKPVPFPNRDRELLPRRRIDRRRHTLLTLVAVTLSVSAIVGYLAVDMLMWIMERVPSGASVSPSAFS
ncbi:hypothetical protein [Halopenitus sp. POP-27]|uniref:hypothetical protein n=1 Tax=Halopenitus sp. POP-27 TaxID=2994425 RepID=UPI0024692D40|nr:hypothetical protein [Halopenitus sp. POP-27]